MAITVINYPKFETITVINYPKFEIGDRVKVSPCYP